MYVKDYWPSVGMIRISDALNEDKTMFRSFTMRIIALALGTAIAVGPVVATEDEAPSLWPHWRMEHMMSGDWGPGGAMGWGRQDGMLDHLDGRLAYMRTEIKITPEQAAAWTEFESAVKSSATAHNDMMLSMREGFKSGSMFDKPLPDRLSWHVSQLEGRLAQMKSVKVAVDKLYVLLMPEQKAAADDVFLPMMGMGMGRGQHMMRW
jgi:hypothetical protein